jgi:hypothetical protein
MGKECGRKGGDKVRKVYERLPFQFLRDFTLINITKQLPIYLSISFLRVDIL